MRRFLFVLVFFVIIQPTAAKADPYTYLNNGIISFAGDDTQDLFSPTPADYENWQDAWLYTTAYDVSSKIKLTNLSGWGVTVTDDLNCYSVAMCSGYDDSLTETRTFDYSGISSFVYGGTTYTYGSGVETIQVNLDGQQLEVVNTISLAQNSNYVVVTTTIENLSASVSNLKLFVNNYDGMVYSDGEYRSTRGNVLDGSFVALTETSQSSNAVLADAQEYSHTGTNYGAILLAGANTGTLSSVLFNGCCAPQAVAYNPQTQVTQTGADGQYAILNQLPTLTSGGTYTLKWAFGGASYTTLTSSAFLNGLLAAVNNTTPAPPAPAVTYVRKSSNLQFNEALYESDKLSDPDGQLRKTVDAIDAKYGNLIK